MTSPKNEKTIIAAFRTMENAQLTVQQLKQLGVLDISVDRMSLYGVEESEERNHNPITGNYPGLASATFDNSMDRDSSIMASVNPSASGMSDGNEENVGEDVVLTVVVSSNKFDQAEKLVRQNGGNF